MGDHEMSTLYGEQPRPEIEPSAETPLTQPPHPPPQEAAENNEPRTENVPPEKSLWRKWKWAIILVAVVVFGFLFGLGFYCLWPTDKPDNNTNNQDLVLEELGEAAYLIDDRNNNDTKYMEPDLIQQGHLKNKEENSTDSDHLAKLSIFYSKNLDQTVSLLRSPCYDFYAFVCKNMVNSFAKENINKFDTLAMMEKNVRRTLLVLLMKPLNKSDDSLLKKMKTFYKMCINTTKIEEEGIEPIMDLLKEIGGWPLLSNEWKVTERWEDIVASINRAGWPIHFPFHLFLKEGIVSGVDLGMAPLLHMRGKGILRFHSREETVWYVKRVASLLNATNDRINNDIEDCITFEYELREITHSTPFKLQKHNMSSLIRDYPQIGWESLFRNLFGSNGMSVLNNTSILLSHSDYNLKVSTLLNKTSGKIIRNYIVWLLMEQAIPLLPQEFRNAEAIFQSRTRRKYPPCLSLLLSTAEVSMGQLYSKNVYHRQVEQISESMIYSIENQAYSFFRNITQTDSLMRKFRTFAYHMEDSLDALEKLEFQSNDTTFANYRRLVAESWNFKSIELRMTTVSFRRFELYKYATYADAQYVVPLNASYIPPAMFQRPLFSAAQPMYLNYGGIGVFIAREATRQLDVLSACDKEKCPRYIDMPYTKECMEDLSRRYVVKQVKKKFDGRRTVSEDLADVIGLKLAYGAYEEFAKDSEEALLPGFNYTARQWFWINAATTLCRYESDESLRETMWTDMRSPAEARVNVAFADIEDFARDFACPVFSGMNTPLKCELFHYP